MERNLILSLALLAISIPSFASGQPKPCNDAGQQRSVQKKIKMQKAKPQNVRPKKQKKDNQMQDVTGFNG